MLDYGDSIPLFPLNTVLFPGMMLPLHIFEDRYKAMVKQCMAGDNMFGVVLTKNRQTQSPNVTQFYFDDLYNVGTTARITAVEHLENNKMNLVTVGQERFIIKNIETSDENFIIGNVDPYPLSDRFNSPHMDTLVNRLRPMVQEYINHLADASGEDLSEATLPADPKALAYLAGTAVQGPLPDKQQLLASDSLGQLIMKTVNVMDRENKILAYMLKAYQAHQQVQRLPFVDYSLN